MKTNLKNKSFLKTIILSTVVGLSSQVSADFFSTDGPVYVGVGYGQTSDKSTIPKDVKNMLDRLKPYGFDYKRKSKSYMFFAGKKYNSNIDIEAYYAKIGDFGDSQTIRGQNGSVNIAIQGKEQSAYGLRGVYKLDEISGFTPYATIGYGKSSTTAFVASDGKSVNKKVSDSGAVFGAGAQKNFNGFIVRAEYFKIQKDMDYIWLGITKSIQ